MARLGRSGWPDGVLDVGQGCFMCWISVDGSHVIHPPLRGATRAKLYGAWDGPSITHWLRSLPLLLPERQQEIVPRPRSKPAGGGISREGWLILRRPAPSKPRRGLQYPLKSEYFFSLSCLKGADLWKRNFWKSFCKAKTSFMESKFAFVFIHCLS